MSKYFRRVANIQEKSTVICLKLLCWQQKHTQNDFFDKLVKSKRIINNFNKNDQRKINFY